MYFTWIILLQNYSADASCNDGLTSYILHLSVTLTHAVLGTNFSFLGHIKDNRDHLVSETQIDSQCWSRHWASQRYNRTTKAFQFDMLYPSNNSAWIKQGWAVAIHLLLKCNEAEEIYSDNLKGDYNQFRRKWLHRVQPNASKNITKQSSIT